MIRHLGLSGFFLLHRDLLELAREVAVEVRGPESARRLLPPGRGRGSSVSSIVCYLTGLSHVDPVENELFLGRFLNEELTALPDIDLDFPRDVRDVLIPRVHERYGRDRCALVAAFATFQVRSAVRDFAKALGLPPGEIERLARAVDPWKTRNDIEDDVPRRRLAALGGARAAGPRRLGPPAPPVPAPRRHGHLHPAADRPLPGPAGVDGGAPDGAVGQGLLRRRRLPQDRPARPGDALGGRALRGRDRPRARASGSTSRGSPTTTRRSTGRSRRRRRWASSRSRAGPRCRCSCAPARRTSTTSPCRWRWCGRGRSRAARCTPTSSAASGCARTPPSRCPTCTRRSSRCCATPSGRSSSRTRCSRWRWPSPASGPGEAEGLRRAMSRRRSEAAIRAYEEKFVAGAMANGASREVAERVWSQIVGFSGLRLPQGALGGVRAARLPVHLAAGALRAGVPVRAAERAADGVLPAGHAGARGAEAGDGRCCRRACGRESVSASAGSSGHAAARRPVDRARAATLRR